MVVDSMSLEEIVKELQEDLNNAQRISYYRYDKFKSAVLKTKLFPLQKYYECKTTKRKNRFFVQFTAGKRGDWKSPYYMYYCIFGRPEGLYCAVLWLEGDYTYIYPPHFFARYRERIIKSNDITPENLIHLYMNRFWGFYSQPVDPNEFKELENWEQLCDEGPVGFVGTCPDGVVFGERTSEYVLIKTIIPESMLYPDQVEFYERVYIRCWSYMKEKYPENLMDFITESEFDYYQYPEPATQDALDKLRQKYKTGE